MMLPWARHDGPPRSLTDIELPVMGLVALLVGLGIAVLLNSLGGVTSGSDEIRRVTDRAAVDSPRAQLAFAAAADRVRAQRRALKKRRAARRRATRAKAVSAALAGSRFRSTSQSRTAGQQTYTQQSLPRKPARSPAPAPKPSPKPAGGGGGGGGSPFDDSG